MLTIDITQTAETPEDLANTLGVIADLIRQGNHSGFEPTWRITEADSWNDDVVPFIDVPAWVTEWPEGADGWLLGAWLDEKDTEAAKVRGQPVITRDQADAWEPTCPVCDTTDLQDRSNYTDYRDLQEFNATAGRVAFFDADQDLDDGDGIGIFCANGHELKFPEDVTTEYG